LIGQYNDIIDQFENWWVIHYRTYSTNIRRIELIHKFNRSPIHFKGETALLMAQTQLIKKGSQWEKLLDLRNGGDIKEQGVNEDGTAFWVGRKLGVKQRPPLDYLPPAL